MIDQTRREEGAPATQRTAVVQRLRDMNAVSARDQYLERGIEVFPLVSAVESVGEQNDFMPIRSSEHFAFRREDIAPPFRQRAPGADAGDALEQRAQ